MKIRFYNEDGNWYADLPKYIEEGGTKEDLQMVLGADTWLDILSEYKNEITLEISTEIIEGFESKLLYVGDVNSFNTGTYLVFPDNHFMWLCDVTKWLFLEYPQVIYYKIVN
jgi:hypothetical protein